MKILLQFKDRFRDWNKNLHVQGSPRSEWRIGTSLVLSIKAAVMCLKCKIRLITGIGQSTVKSIWCTEWEHSIQKVSFYTFHLEAPHCWGKPNTRSIFRSTRASKKGRLFQITGDPETSELGCDWRASPSGLVKNKAFHPQEVVSRGGNGGGNHGNGQSEWERRARRGWEGALILLTLRELPTRHCTRIAVGVSRYPREMGLPRSSNFKSAHFRKKAA